MGDLRYISGNSQIKFLIFFQFPNSVKQWLVVLWHEALNAVLCYALALRGGGEEA
ncbi:hypothetical protein T11_842 [Trichinella zimbabwensis]|uniref:Uncharacterized protein n=1 Tax=Trichinella zimbabwensis TaxID=268475 RepID=A0A0V1GC79_9BILA|nr:hypothetical protein T11_842 [Trichinella zimbabwensis]